MHLASCVYLFLITTAAEVSSFSGQRLSPSTTLIKSTRRRRLHSGLLLSSSSSTRDSLLRHYLHRRNDLYHFDRDEESHDDIEDFCAPMETDWRISSSTGTGDSKNKSVSRSFQMKFFGQSLLSTVVAFPMSVAAAAPSVVTKIQVMGEMLFAGMLSIAFLQGLVALIQYRTNPSGQLINPPGLTYGTAQPKSEGGDEDDTARESKKVTRTTEAIPPPLSSAETTIDTRNTLLSTSSQHGSAPEQESRGGAIQTTNETSLKPEIFAASSISTAFPSTLSEDISRYTKVLSTINKWFVLLVPFVGRQWSFILQRNTHLFHLGFMVTLARVFDLPHQWFDLFDRQFRRGDNTTSSLTTSQYSEADHIMDQSIDRIVVLGDSLAIGLGSINMFDSNKNSSVAFERIENIDERWKTGNDNNTSIDSAVDEKIGPVFPRVLAETLATGERQKVSWRSAGVDGGDTEMINKYCLDVVKEEVDAGRTPDLVTLILGVNDFKYFMASNPLWGRSPGPRAFRKRLKKLIKEIHEIAPRCIVVLPSVPAQMFHRNSPLNIFPLNFFVDSLLAFWESLKNQVAIEINRECDKSNDAIQIGRVVYLRTSPIEVSEWFSAPDPTKDSPETDEGLIAADGVHPNAKCYALWAESIGRQLMDLQVQDAPRTVESETAVYSSSSSGLTTVKIQFDGSLRPPRDPGYTVVERSLAVCSASISVPGFKGMGTKILPVELATTSQHTEYEGIILALEWLCEHSNREFLIEALPTYLRNQSDSEGERRVSIEIEGDCKTVIDQLSGRSVPRKLQVLHQQATSLVETIKERFRSDGFHFDFDYRHIPRSQNVLCDHLCSTLAEAMVLQTYRACVGDLEAVERAVTSEEFVSEGKGLPNLDHILRHYLDQYKSIIPYSKRLHLYHRIASLARKLEDFEQLEKVGRRLCDESKCLIPDSINKQNLNHAFQQGVRYQLEALEGMEREKEYARMKHKYRVLLETEMGDSMTEASIEDDTQFSKDLKALPAEWETIVKLWKEDATTQISISPLTIEEPFETWVVDR
mmetsp:Transcript_37354/g.90787  ORF Transcript_37354/g.90787 Transcript_37354/m.90787 type:complete len:1040 (-) Transcript_37354:27-3146(-)